MKTLTKKQAVCFGLLISSCAMIQPQEKPVFISLGSWCVPALFLKNYNLRETPMPFDWIMSGPIENLCTILKNNFNNFLRKENLTLSMTSVNDHGSGCSFNHDFPIMGSGNYAIVSNFLDYYPIVKLRYDHRIQRLNELVNANRHVIFIRLDLDGNKQKGQQLHDCLASLYPTLDFDILYIGFNEEYKKPWRIDRVTNVYIEGKTIEHGIDYNSSSWQFVRSMVEYLSGTTMQQLAQTLGHPEDESF